MSPVRKAVNYLVFLLLIPVCILLGVFVFRDRAYLWISLAVAALACVPFFLSFERKGHDTRRLILLAVMVALSVLGRFVFGAVPHFKPVTTIVVITGIYLGAESGFLCGALSAILSNILFGQGPWTPFQMFAWGIVGWIAGLLSPWLRKSRVFLLLYGVFSGVLYSLLMDIWTVLWWGEFSLSRYLAALASAVPVTAVYAVSNVIFLLVLTRPIGQKLERIIFKYGI